MPSDEKHPSRVPMWKGVRVSYTIIALCLFPLAIGGYWAYGQLVCSCTHLNNAILHYWYDLLIASIHFWTGITDSNLKWRNPNSSVRVPWKRHCAMASGDDQFIRDHKCPELLPNLRHAYVWWLGVHLHDTLQEALPVVATCHPPRHLWLLLLLHSRSNALCRQFCGSNWRYLIACHSGLPLFHVAQDQEAKGLRFRVVAQLVLGHLRNLLKCITGGC